MSAEESIMWRPFWIVQQNVCLVVLTKSQNVLTPNSILRDLLSLNRVTVLRHQLFYPEAVWGIFFFYVKGYWKLKIDSASRQNHRVFQVMVINCLLQQRKWHCRTPTIQWHHQKMSKMPLAELCRNTWTDAKGEIKEWDISSGLV